MTVKLFIGVLTIAHLVGYVLLVYWVTHIKAGGDAKEGEIIDHIWDGDLKEINNPMPGWWLKLFYLMLSFGFLYLILYPGVFKGIRGWTQVSQYEEQSREVNERSKEYFKVYAQKDIEELANDVHALDSGRRIFTQNCAVCHGTDAGGVAGSYPNLTDKDWIWGGKPENIIKTITDGRSPLMPPGGALVSNAKEPTSEDEHKLEAVASYVASLSGHEGDAALIAEGKELFGKSCIACHGAEGVGNPMLGAPKLADDIWHYTYSGQDTDTLKEFIKGQILNPPNNKMPAWKDTLSPERIKVVSAYIYSLSQDK